VPRPPPRPDTRIADTFPVITAAGAVQGRSRPGPRSAPRRYIARLAEPDPRARRRSALWEELITPAGARRGLPALGPPLTTAARALARGGPGASQPERGVLQPRRRPAPTRERGALQLAAARS